MCCGAVPCWWTRQTTQGRRGAGRALDAGRSGGRCPQPRYRDGGTAAPGGDATPARGAGGQGAGGGEGAADARGAVLGPSRGGAGGARGGRPEAAPELGE